MKIKFLSGKVKRVIVFLITLFCFGVANAQGVKAPCYFVAKTKDTTFCKELSYTTTAQGYLKKIEYVDMDGNKISKKGKDELPDVQTFYLNGTFIDKTPLKADKPDGYIRYTKREVDGKLIVYLAQQEYNSTVSYTPGSAFGDFSTGGPSGIYRFYIKMPDGRFYKINDKSNLNNFIKPFLLKCKEFKNEYKGDFSTREEPFIDMIKLYNSICK